MRDEGRLAACHKQGTIDAEVASCSSYWSDEHRAVKSACPWSQDKGAADEVRAGDSEDSDSASDNRTVAALNTCDSTYADDSTGARSSGSTVHAGDRSPAYDAKRACTTHARGRTCPDHAERASIPAHSLAAARPANADPATRRAPRQDADGPGARLAFVGASAYWREGCPLPASAGPSRLLV
jgi:hypothetical protein